ncbi:MAG: UDP-3-O-(3-hydroxymyristoyl)glucosamine N-acyltransferase [Planctomycetes bacterium]|nr:UDP-3-O-(3-hydroxymyristoyl)glucosamine N-acyltransferase [Planctomycetota bacterium]
MRINIRQLAELVEGKVVGDAELIVETARPLAEAKPGDITFIENEKHLAQLHACPAAAAVVPHALSDPRKTMIQTSDPLAAFATIVRHLHGRPEQLPHGIDPRAVVHPNAQIGAEVSILPFASIGEGAVVGPRCRIHCGVAIGRDCKLGADVVLYPNVVLYDGTILGDRTVIHANSVIGADGFGYRFQSGRHVKVPQLGHVEIGNDVEIGACTTIDRGTFQATVIGEGTKIDNLVQIGHNCRIGKHNILVSQMGMAGSSSTDEYVVIAGQVGITDHVHIGKGALIGAKAGVTKDVPAGQRTLGAPATPEREQKRILMSLEKLPEMRKEIRTIKKHLGMADEAA